MIRVGITGHTGFIGTHLYNWLRLQPDHFELIPFRDEIFDDFFGMKEWVSRCDAIVHLAALNRHNDPAEIYRVNIRLVGDLVRAMEEAGVTPHVLFSGSTQEEFDNPYGKSKKEGREGMGRADRRCFYRAGDPQCVWTLRKSLLQCCRGDLLSPAEPRGDAPD